MEASKPSINLMLEQIGLDSKGRKIGTSNVRKTPENGSMYAERLAKMIPSPVINEHAPIVEQEDPDLQESNNISKDSNFSDYIRVPTKINKLNQPNLLQKR